MEEKNVPVTTANMRKLGFGAGVIARFTKQRKDGRGRGRPKRQE